MAHTVGLISQELLDADDIDGAFGSVVCDRLSFGGLAFHPGPAIGRTNLPGMG